MKIKEIKEILEKHEKWLNCEEGGKRADFSEADLCGANLSGVNLSSANFRGANLYGVDFSGANLYGVDFSGADLCEAYLENAELRRVNFSGAKNILSPIKYIKDNFETTDNGIIAYKTFGSVYMPPKEWTIQSGSIITQSCNMNRTDTCGCGINIAPIEWVRRHCIGDIWKVLIRWEWLCGVCVPYNTDGKIRCEMVELVEVVEHNKTYRVIKEV